MEIFAFIVVFVILLALVMIPPQMAETRGRSQLGWFILGLMNWPMAVIALLVLGPTYEEIERRQREEEDG